MNYIGIDPGVGGGIACISKYDVEVWNMPDSDVCLFDLIDNLGPDAKCVIEEVGAFQGQAARASFTFGSQYGRARMAVVAAGVPLELARPQMWQKAMGLSKTKEETKTERKRRLKIRAQEMFPGIKVTNTTADALLLAEYCRRLFERRSDAS